MCCSIKHKNISWGSIKDIINMLNLSFKQPKIGLDLHSSQHQNQKGNNIMNETCEHNMSSGLNLI